MANASSATESFSRMLRVCACFSDLRGEVKEQHVEKALRSKWKQHFERASIYTALRWVATPS